MDRPNFSEIKNLIPENINKDITVGILMIIVVLSAVVAYQITDFSDDINSELHLDMEIEILEVSGVTDQPVVENSVSITTTSDCSNVLQNQTTTDRGRANFDVFLNQTDDISFCLQDVQSDSIELSDLIDRKVDQEEFNEIYYFKIIDYNISKVEG